MKFIILVSLWVILSIKNVFGQAEEGDICTDEDNKNGVCTDVNKCIQATENLKKNIQPKICGFVQSEVLVCCSNVPISIGVNTTKKTVNITSHIKKPTTTSGEISKAKCREYAQYSYRSIISPILSTKQQKEKIYDCHVNAEILTIGSFVASRQEFPHMAHLGYLSKDKSKIEYKCGGSLISETFVLTAAHCLSSPTVGPPQFARFGVTNVDDQEHRQEIRVIQHFIHPEFKNYKLYNDIGLVKLETPVDFNEYVRPACLNTIRNINYRTAVVPGWGVKGIGETGSKDLLKSILDIVANKPCNDSYTKELNVTNVIKNGILEDIMICAAITSDQRKNACQGDSGGPLQERIHNSEDLQCMTSIIGITSFGKKCIPGEVGFPGVYTRVSTYVSWIEETVWPDVL